MFALLLAYYQHAPTARFLNQIADWKARSGYVFTFASTVIAAAFLPEIMRIVFFQRGRLHRHNFGNLLFTIPFWGVMGICVDVFYQAQARVFGPAVDFGTVAVKVAVDQFGYTALFATPVSCLLYDWKHHGYDVAKVIAMVDRHYYRRAVFPTLITNWAVWIPLISVVYCLPGTLQIPLFSLALSLWVMLFTWMSASRNHGVLDS